MTALASHQAGEQLAKLVATTKPALAIVHLQEQIAIASTRARPFRIGALLQDASSIASVRGEKAAVITMAPA
jgi:hypothetical protein